MLAGEVAARDLGKPAGTQMTLDLVLDAVVGDLAQAPVKRGAVGQMTRGCLLSNDHEYPPSGHHMVKPGKRGQRIAMLEGDSESGCHGWRCRRSDGRRLSVGHDGKRGRGDSPWSADLLASDRAGPSRRLALEDQELPEETAAPAWGCRGGRSFLSFWDSSSLWASQSSSASSSSTTSWLLFWWGGLCALPARRCRGRRSFSSLRGGSYEAACASDACAVPSWLTGTSRSLRSSRVVACPSRPWRFLRMMMSISPGRSESRS